jgi:GAF domain-containing protein
MSALEVTASPAAGDVIGQLRRFLELGAAQLDAAIRESDVRVEKLAAAVSGVAADARALELVARTLESQDPAAVHYARQRIRELTQALSAHADQTVTALQFYDKLIQRLTHVREGLVMPSDSAALKPGAVDWNGLLEQVRARYSTVEERVLFDFMMRGLNAEQMLKALSGLRASTAAGEFEAF